MKTFPCFSFGAIATVFSLCFTIPTFANNSSLIQPISIPTEKSKNCPRDLTTLTTQLLQDIPDYGNRVIQRTQDKHQQANIQTYIVAAGRPEFEPLNLPQIKYTEAKDNQPQQIFFTTLEKQYTNNQKIERETYHWLFVTLTDSGWYLVTMFSRFGNATKNTPPTPPQESSNGIIGQAVNLWLRDCRADALH